MLPLFAVAIFAAAGLLFVVQPMAGKLVLPLLGGGPGVWNTAMVFFQTALLLGYLYAHALSRLRRPGAQVAVHAALLALAAIFLPIGLHGATPDPEGSPAGWTLRLLAGAVGIPFFAIASAGPLLQQWFARTNHPAARDPYFLYAASNAGSMLGLLGYPFLAEPWLTLAQQRAAWSIGFGLFALLALACGVAMLRRPRDTASAAPDSSPGAASSLVSWPARARWVLLAFVPSSLILGTTQYLTSDIAAVPLLWVAPLAAYLVSFIVAFSRFGPVAGRAAGALLPLAAGGIALVAWAELRQPILGIAALHLALLLLAGLACHGRLASLRPDPSRLTEYFLLIAVGGVLGGVFNALLAPHLFNVVAEYPLMIALACFVAGPAMLLPRRAVPSARFAFAAAITFAVGLTLLLAMGRPEKGETVILRERTFFGTYRVFDRREKSAQWRHLWHGRTLHGKQILDDFRRREPTTYYARSGPMGDIMAALTSRPAFTDVAVVGLGTGTLATYGRPGMRLDFYEIDPAVVRLASDPALFTYLQDTAAAVTHTVGDARLTIQRRPPGAYDLIVLDAFSSDAIPIHLITLEGLSIFLSRLTPDGVLAVHVSNWYLDLEPVLAAACSALGVHALARSDNDEEAPGETSSDWVILAKDPATLDPWRTMHGWRELPASAKLRAWTDDYSDLLAVFNFAAD